MLIEAKGEKVSPLRDKAPNLDWERLRWHAERVVSENGPLGEFWALLEEWVEGYFAENAIPIWRKLTERAATRLYFGELWLFCALLSSSCYGMPLDIVSDRDPRFTARFWQKVFTLLGTQLSMSTADHPQSDGQTERVNRVLGDLLKSYAYSFQQWSDCLPMAEFAINNSVHTSTVHTPFYVNAMRHPRLPSMLGTVASSLSGEDLRLHPNNRRRALIPTQYQQ
ncbi:hypothetical protein PC128_g25439 [Phytophthora cactorum]|nr:hypothetical protein PC128_g25439 [Phytophthora cactorum]